MLRDKFVKFLCLSFCYEYCGEFLQLQKMQSTPLRGSHSKQAQVEAKVELQSGTKSSPTSAAKSATSKAGVEQKKLPKKDKKEKQGKPTTSAAETKAKHSKQKENRKWF